MSQSSSTSSSNSGRFLIGFASTAALLLLLGTGLSLYLGAPSGDLMRIGKLASIDWQPTHIQPPLVRVLTPTLSVPSIIVLGDSFSAENLWQSELSRLTGQTTQTWHYKDIGCIDDWLRNTIKDHSSHASPIIVIESIEREFISRFSSATENCKPYAGQPISLKAEIFHTEKTDTSIFPIDIRYVFSAAKNHFSPGAHSGRKESRSAVSVDLTTDGLFSNQRSKRLSYFQGDDRKWQDWSIDRQQAALTYLTQMQAMAKQEDKQLIIAVIPDKSTTYAPWIKTGQLPATPQADLFQALAATLGGNSNYLPAFRQAAHELKDFYRPDDTHLSLDGYRLLAREVSKRIYP